MIIGVDFDGTCVSHEFPEIGNDIGAVPILRKLIENGHQLILFTMRSNSLSHEGASDEVPKVHRGPFLDDAIGWFKHHNIPLHGVNNNPDQHKWTTSPKAYCHLYIDDAALGCPLVFNGEISNRFFVNWHKVEFKLKEMRLIK